MSNISITGNPSGTGIFTVQSPNSNVDRVLTLPDNTGTIITTGSTFAGTGPTFSVYGNANQTGLTSTAFTKVAFNTESADTAGCFDTSLYRFIPNVAGYYQFNFSCYVTGSNIASAEPFIYRNGSSYSSGQYMVVSAAALILTASNIIYCNGTTDSIEFYMYASTSAGTYTINHSQLYTYASGALVRDA